MADGDEQMDVEFVDALLQWDHSGDIGVKDTVGSCHVTADGVGASSSERWVLAARRKKRSARVFWHSRYKSACQLLDIVVAAVPKNRREHYEKMIQNLKDGKGKLQVVYLL